MNALNSNRTGLLARTMLTSLALCAALCLGACGDSPSGGGGGGDSSSSGGAKQDGGATPQEVVDGLMAAAEAEDFGALVPYVIPEQRAALAYGIGVMPISLMVGLAEAMMPAAEALGGEEAEKAKTKIADMKAAHEALMKKYGVDALDEGAMQATGGDEAAVMKLFNESMGDIDHGAFITEAMALLETFSDKGVKDSGGAMKEFDKKLVNVQVDGDTATADMEGEDGKLTLVKIAGRWYADMKTMK